MKILVTGSSGFLGKHVMPVLEKFYGKENVFGLSSKEFNLLDAQEVERMFQIYKPEIVVHLAAYSGGIGGQ